MLHLVKVMKEKHDDGVVQPTWGLSPITWTRMSDTLPVSEKSVETETETETNDQIEPEVESEIVGQSWPGKIPHLLFRNKP